ncbi:MAG: (d)CMP kinase [Chloroflexi bacterium]|nr:(d)CMP kinase [Chloroflexota bacterium]
MDKLTIAIDGPAASGKSTVADLLAARLGYLYLDTGVMYRAVTWAALDRGIAIPDETAVSRLAESLLIEVRPPSVRDGRQYDVLADGVDITWRIREPDVNTQVSPVSAYRGVRAALTEQQRRIAAPGGVIVVGRDIGTVVLPSAEVKIYLDATVEERARRRHLEFVARGQEISYEQVLADLQRRDLFDSTRTEAPLSIPDGAIIIDSTRMTVEQVAQRIAEIVEAAARPRRRACKRR